MKEKRFSDFELMNTKGTTLSIEFGIKQELRAAGFDLNKPIIKFQDELTMDLVYQQED